MQRCARLAALGRLGNLGTAPKWRKLLDSDDAGWLTREEAPKSMAGSFEDGLSVARQ